MAEGKSVVQCMDITPQLVESAVRVLEQWCEQKGNKCDGCPLFHDYEGCLAMDDIPSNWRSSV